MEEEKIKCPYCKSTQLTTTQDKLKLGRAIGGAILAGGVGAIIGGTTNKGVKLYCMNCGKQFTPQERIQLEKRMANKEAFKNQTQKQKRQSYGCMLIVLIVFVIILTLFLKSCG